MLHRGLVAQLCCDLRTSAITLSLQFFLDLGIQRSLNLNIGWHFHCSILALDFHANNDGAHQLRLGREIAARIWAGISSTNSIPWPRWGVSFSAGWKTAMSNGQSAVL